MICATLLVLSLSGTAASPVTILKVATQHQEKGRHGEVIKITTNFLETANPPKNKDYWQASFLYVRGFSWSVQEEPQQARNDYQKAIDLLEPLGDHEAYQAMRSLLNLSLANLVMKEKGENAFRDAANLIEKALGDEQLSSENKGYAYLMKSRLAFAEGNYPQSEAWAVLSLENYLLAANNNEKDARVINATSELAFTQMLNNKWEAGIANTERAQKNAIRTSQTNKFHFSIVNKIFYTRCYEGKSANNLIQSVRSYAARMHNGELLDNLNWVLNQCPSARLVAP